MDSGNQGHHRDDLGAYEKALVFSSLPVARSPLPVKATLIFFGQREAGSR